MKRSEVNAYIKYAKDLFEKNHIFLPEFGYWSMEEWKEHKDEIGAIKDLMLGWDMTDHGLGKFDEIGLVLFTIRNGLLDRSDIGVPYAEKLLVFQEGQRAPFHYHKNKVEDIINRGVGVMAIRLYNTVDGKIADTPVEVWQDGIRHVYQAGEEILIYPGNSITLEAYVAHSMGPKAGTGDLICGEVSKINDDKTDNYHVEITPCQYMEIEEDEPILHPLCNEYDRVLK